MSSTSLPSNPSENRGPILDAVAITNTGAAVLVMATRLGVRGRMIRNIGNDDWIMTATTVVSLAGMSMVLAEVRYGAGRHIGDIPPESLKKGLQLNLFSQLVFLWGICFAKMSIGTSLLRIASTRFWKRTILGFMIFVMIYTTVGFVTILAQCSDIRALWDLSLRANATCWPAKTTQIFGYVNFSLNIFSDIVFSLGIPVPMLWNINVTTRTKMSLFFILGLGCFATSCAIVRITYLGTYGMSGDWLWDTVDLATWSVVELNISIIAGSLPSLRPLFKKFLGTVYGSGSRMKAYYGHGGSASRTSRKGTKQWQPFSMTDGKKSKNSRHVPLVPTGRSLDDGSSQVQLNEHMQGCSPVRSQDSFELCSYKVEAHITTESPPSLVRKPTISGGITKTTTTTVSYDDPRSV